MNIIILIIGIILGFIFFKYIYNILIFILAVILEFIFIIIKVFNKRKYYYLKYKMANFLCNQLKYKISLIQKELKNSVTPEDLPEKILKYKNNLKKAKQIRDKYTKKLYDLQ